MSLDIIRLRRELEELKRKVDEQEKRIAMLEPKKKLTLPSRDAEANR